MAEELLFHLQHFTFTLVFTLVLCGLFLAVSSFYVRRLTLNSASMKVYGLFYGLKPLQRWALAVSVVKLCFLWSTLIQFSRIQSDQLLLYLILIVLGMLLNFGQLAALKTALCDLCLLGGLFFVNVLQQFIFEIRSEWGFVAVAIALSVFLACFALYDFLDEVWALSKRKRDSLCRD